MEKMTPQARATAAAGPSALAFANGITRRIFLRPRKRHQINYMTKLQTCRPR